MFLLNINDPENPIELAFQARYGNIVSYQWSVDFTLYWTFDW
jgi:WD repeat-containing protein 19